jgi:hypothetical protein
MKINVRITLNEEEDAMFERLRESLVGASDSEVVRFAIRKAATKISPVFTKDSFAGKISDEEANRRYQTGDYPSKTLRDGGDLTYEAM